MVYAIVKQGHLIKIKGASAWQDKDLAQKHLDTLKERDYKHFQAWTVEAINADWEKDVGPHRYMPSDPSVGTLLKDCEVISEPT